MWAPKIWKLGITGGIGSGKSNVAKVISTFNIPVIDADKLGHAAYEKNTKAYHAVVKLFGEKAVKPDGEIDRAYIGSQVFADKQKMKQLTDIVWPCINDLARASILHFEALGHKLVVIEAAILIEAKWFDMIDELWVVTVPPEVACERIQKRNNLSVEQAMVRINAQLSNAEREAYGDQIISTNQEIEKTQVIIESKYQDLLKRIESSDFTELRRRMKVVAHRL